MSQNSASRTIVVNLIKVLISGFLVYILLRRIGVSTLLTNITQAERTFILLALLCFVASNFLGSFQWYLLLKSRDIEISLLKVISYYHVGLFFNNFLIGYIGGDAFRVYDVHRSSGDTTSAISTVFFDRFVGFFTMTSMAVLTSFYLASRKIMPNSTSLTLAIILVVWIAGLMVLFNENIAQKFAWIFKLLLPKVLHAKMRDVYYGINQFRHNKLLLVQILLVSVGVQSLRITTHYWTSRSVGVNAPVSYFFIFIPIVALAASLPISLGGIGVREQSGVALFAQIGLPSASVVAFEFLAYIIGIVATLPGGLIFALRKEHKKPKINSE